MELIDFFQYLAKLKRTKRTAWVREGIKNSESVADHSFSAAILAMVLAPRFDVNQEKLIKIALIHDLAESITGDIVTHRGRKIDRKKLKDKKGKEKKAMRKIFSSLKDGGEYLELFEEMNLEKTKEAKLVKDFDKLDAAFQAFEYEKSDGKNLEEIFVYAETLIENPKLKEIINQIKSLRNISLNIIVTHPERNY